MCTRTPTNVKFATQVQIHLEGKAEAGPGHRHSHTTHSGPPPGPSEMQVPVPQDRNAPKLLLAHASAHYNLNIVSVIFPERCRVGRLPFEQFQFLTEMLQWLISTQLRSQPAHGRVKNRKCYPLVCSDVPGDIVTGCILRRILFNTSVFKYKAVGCSSFRKHKYPFFCCTVSVCEIL